MSDSGEPGLSGHQSLAHKLAAIATASMKRKLNAQRPAWMNKLDKWWTRWHLVIGWTLFAAQILALVAYHIRRF